MRIRHILLAILLAGLVSSTGQASDVTVFGQVLNDLGRPVCEATVRIVWDTYIVDEDSTDTQGHYELLVPDAQTLVQEIDTAKSVRTQLYPNVPNPFNPSTTIQFSLSQSTFVQLNIYNVLGQPVRTLVKERLPAGIYQVVWDGLDENGQITAAGVYAYRLAAGWYTDTRPMTKLDGGAQSNGGRALRLLSSDLVSKRRIEQNAGYRLEVSRPGIIQQYAEELRFMADQAYVQRDLVVRHLESAIASMELVEIERGVTWVSAYWGYNAPKLVYDGDAFYSVGLWGEYGGAKGVVYCYQDGQWFRGRELLDIYQPPMLLLDSGKRLHVIYNPLEKPAVYLRGREPDNVEDFDSIPMPSKMKNAYYMGVGIHEGRVGLAYISTPDYSFYFTVLDLDTATWTEPIMLQKGQHNVKPHTAWVYPVVVPDDGGVHLMVTNCPDGGEGNTYNRILYMYLPYDVQTPPTPEIVAEGPIGNITFGETMWVAQNRAVYATAQLHRYVYGEEPASDAPPAGLYVLRRDPVSAEWTSHYVTAPSVGGLFEDEYGRLWLSAAAGNRIDLFTSTDQGQHWDAVNDRPDFTPFGLCSTFFLHSLHPASGSVMSDVPCAVFSTTVPESSPLEYVLWFLRMNTILR